MGRLARDVEMDPNRVAVYHLYSRCVRSMFLIGLGGQDGQKDEHRKVWIEDRQNRLFEIYAIDLVVFVTMDTHIHHIIVTRPDLAKDWAPEEVIRRWYAIHLLYGPNNRALEKTPERLAELALDEDLVAKLRKRSAAKRPTLSDKARAPLA